MYARLFSERSVGQAISKNGVGNGVYVGERDTPTLGERFGLQVGETLNSGWLLGWTISLLLTPVLSHIGIPPIADEPTSLLVPLTTLGFPSRNAMFRPKMCQTENSSFVNRRAVILGSIPEASP
jgi:hypothetical protein